MLDSSKIQSGFDAELQLGRLWFLTAIQTLSDNGALALPNGITIDDVEIIDDPNWDLELLTSLGIPVRAGMAITNNQFVFTTNFNDTTFQIDLPNFGQLAGPPVLKKVIGDNGFENAMAILINLDIRAEAQNQGPLPAGEHLERGNADDAVSFLPEGQHLALGLARDLFKRYANHIWHTELRDEDGTHPLPAPGEEKKGDWKRVKVSVTQKRIKFTLEGEVPIDFWPDANVSLELELKPRLKDGKLTFEIDTDLDVDTGFWGDLLAFTIGALVGFLIALFTGGLLLIPAIGLGAVVVLEIAEYAVGEIIERMIIARDENGNRIAVQSCSDGIVQFASPKPPENSLSIGVLDAVPSSIPVLFDTDDALFNRTVVVAAHFDEILLNGEGLVVAGKSQPSELFEPQVARLVESAYEQDELKQLKYMVPSTGREAVLDLQDVLARLSENELRPPIKAEAELDDPIRSIPAGKLCCPCLKPAQIQREETVITRIRFDNGLELNVPDAILLQEYAGVYLEDLQLIRPSNAKAYYRSRPNETTEDNFEKLPEF